MYSCHTVNKSNMIQIQCLQWVMQGWHQQPCNTSHPHAIAAGPFNEILNETNRESGLLTLLVSEDDGFIYANEGR